MNATPTGRAPEQAGGSPAVVARMLPSIAAVNRAIVACQRCPRLRAYCRRVAQEKKREFRDWTYWGQPVPGFGDPRARLLIVGLAPAAHGANRTGRMFTGDSSGSWLYEALHRFGFASGPHAVSRHDGLTLTDCYIAAVARCAPPGNKPSPGELERCRPYLAAEVGLLGRVQLVVTLGRIAHEGWLKAAGWWDRLAPRERPKFAHGATALLPDGTVVVSSYHPSRQNTNTGRLTRAMWHAVFRRARARLERAEQPHRIRVASPDRRGGPPGVKLRGEPATNWSTNSLRVGSRTSARRARAAGPAGTGPSGPTAWSAR